MYLPTALGGYAFEKRKYFNRAYFGLMIPFRHRRPFLDQQVPTPRHKSLMSLKVLPKSCVRECNFYVAGSAELSNLFQKMRTRCPHLLEKVGGFCGSSNIKSPPFPYTRKPSAPPESETFPRENQLLRSKFSYPALLHSSSGT